VKGNIDRTINRTIARLETFDNILFIFPSPFSSSRINFTFYKFKRSGIIFYILKYRIFHSTNESDTTPTKCPEHPKK